MRKEVRKKIAINVLLVLILVVMTAVPAFADDYDTNFLDLLRTDGFKGNNSLLAKLGAVPGTIVAYFISFAGILITSFLMIGEGTNLIYLSRPMWFDRINEARQQRLSGGAGNMTTVDRLLSYLWDVKDFSDFSLNNPDQGMGIGANGLPSVGVYLRDRFVYVFSLVVLATVFISGALFGIYRGLGNAGNIIANYAASFDYGGTVRRWMDSDKDYKFYYNEKTIDGKNQASIARKIYRTLKDLEPDNNTRDYLDNIGSKTAKWVADMADEGGVDFSQPGLVANARYESMEPVGSTGTTVLYKTTAEFGVPRDGYIVVVINELISSTPGGGSLGKTTYPHLWGSSSSIGGGSGSISAPTSIDFSKASVDGGSSGLSIYKPQTASNLYLRYTFSTSEFRVPAKIEGATVVANTESSAYQKMVDFIDKNAGKAVLREVTLIGKVTASTVGENEKITNEIKQDYTKYQHYPSGALIWINN